MLSCRSSIFFSDLTFPARDTLLIRQPTDLKKSSGQPEDYKEVLEKPRNGISWRQLCLCMFIFRSAPISATTCGCNKEITKDHSRSAQYIETLGKECDLIKDSLTGIGTVEQLHFGGGSPTFLNNEEIVQVMETLTSRFPLEKDAEISIEVDPRCLRP